MTTTEVEKKAAARIVRVTESAMAHIQRTFTRQLARIQKVEKKFGMTGVGGEVREQRDRKEVSIPRGRPANGDKDRFHSNDLLPILNKINGEFTLTDLQEKASKAGVEAEKQQISSAVHRFMKLGKVKVVKAGFGRGIKAIYTVKK